MQFLFNEVYLPHKGLARNSLSAVYGVGVKKASYLLSAVGINKMLPIKGLTKHKFSMLSSVMKKYWLVDSPLQRARYNGLRAFLELNNYKSLRYRSFLPIRGQASRTNAKTAKKRRSKR